MVKLNMRVGAISALFLAIASILAPTAWSAEAPKYKGVFAERDPATGAYTLLEHSVPMTQIESHLGFMAGATAALAFKGDHSPVRFHVGDKLEFVVPEASRYDDPNIKLQFFILQSKQDHRILPVQNYGGVWGIKASNKSSEDYAVPFVVSQFNDLLIKVTPAKQLDPGEYCLAGTGTHDGFCFGVDP